MRKFRLRLNGLHGLSGPMMLVFGFGGVFSLGEGDRIASTFGVIYGIGVLIAAAFFIAAFWEN